MTPSPYNRGTGNSVPTDSLFFAAIAAAAADLDALESHETPEREREFLAAMTGLVQLSCDWVEPHVAAGTRPVMPDDVKATYSRLLRARNALLDYTPAGEAS